MLRRRKSMARDVKNRFVTVMILKIEQAPKTELSYLTAFFEGRKVVKTQLDRDASRRLATFMYHCNLYVFLQKREIAVTPEK